MQKESFSLNSWENFSNRRNKLWGRLLWETACFFRKKSKLAKHLLIMTWFYVRLSKWWRWNK